MKVNDMELKAHCIKQVKQRIKDLEPYEPEWRLKELKHIKTQVYGLRDLFFIFTSEHIDDISAPIKEAIKQAELEVRGCLEK